MKLGCYKNNENLKKRSSMNDYGLYNSKQYCIRKIDNN